MESSEPLDTGTLPNKSSSMKPHELDQIEDEDNLDASTKVSKYEQKELILEKPKAQLEQPKKSATSQIKYNQLVKDFDNILKQAPDNIGPTALATWNTLGPFDLQKYLDQYKFTLDERLKLTIDLGWQGKPYQYFGQMAKEQEIGMGGEKRSKKDGFGRFLMIGNHIYEGQFKDGRYHGFGRFIYENGGYYIGNYKDGHRCGDGVLIDANGKKHDKIWTNGN